jgi:uncharacterized phage-associated protein
MAASNTEPQWRTFCRDSYKFNQLVLYIAKRSEDDPRFGAVKLNKLLYYMDTRSYLELGKPITGAVYRHLPAGPVPYDIMEAKRQLVDAGHARIEWQPYFNYRQERLVALQCAEISWLSEHERQIVDEVFDQLWEYNGTELSNISHREWGWQLTGNYENIPYELAWLSPEPVPIEAIEHGLQIAKEYGLVNE